MNAKAGGNSLVLNFIPANNSSQWSSIKKDVIRDVLLRMGP